MAIEILPAHMTFEARDTATGSRVATITYARLPEREEPDEAVIARLIGAFDAIPPITPAWAGRNYVLGVFLPALAAHGLVVVREQP